MSVSRLPLQARDKRSDKPPGGSRNGSEGLLSHEDCHQSALDSRSGVHQTPRGKKNLEEKEENSSQVDSAAVSGEGLGHCWSLNWLDPRKSFSDP